MLASGEIADPQTWNRYTYARNNPLKYIDPNGLKPIWIQRTGQDGTLLGVQQIDSGDRGNYSADDGWSDVTFDSNGRFTYSADGGNGGVRNAVLFQGGGWDWESNVQSPLTAGDQARIAQNPLQFSRTGQVPTDNGSVIRAPDSFSVNANFGIIGGTLKVDSYGTWYLNSDTVATAVDWGNLGSSNPVQFSFGASASWLLQTEAPTQLELESFNTGWGYNIGAGRGVAGGLDISPTNSGTKAAINIGGGVGVNASGGYGFRLGQTPSVGWRGAPR